jgi:hypothetical protein
MLYRWNFFTYLGMIAIYLAAILIYPVKVLRAKLLKLNRPSLADQFEWAYSLKRFYDIIGFVGSFVVFGAIFLISKLFSKV